MKIGLTFRLCHLLGILLATTVCAVFSPAPTARAQGAFTDPFTTAGLDPNFTNVSGTWTIAGGNYSLTSNYQTFDFSTLTAAGDTNYTNFSLSYDVTNASNGGVFFHGDSTGNNGIVFIARPTSGDAYFINRTNGSFGGFLSADTALTGVNGGGLHITLTGTGNNYTAVISTAANPTVPIDTVTINGNATAANYTSGYTGFYSYGTAPYDHYDNLSTVPEPSTWAVMLGGGLLIGALQLSRRKGA